MSAKHPKCRPPRGVKTLYLKRAGDGIGRWCKDDGKPHEVFVAKRESPADDPWGEYGEVYSVKGCTCSPYATCPIAKGLSSAAERWGAANLVIRPKAK